MEIERDKCCYEASELRHVPFISNRRDMIKFLLKMVGCPVTHVLRFRIRRSDARYNVNWDGLLHELEYKYPHLRSIYKARDCDMNRLKVLLARQFSLSMFEEPDFVSPSLGIHPDFRNRLIQRFKVDCDMFGTYWNTDIRVKYCAYFPELEHRTDCVGNPWHVTPKSGVYLVMPPFHEILVKVMITRMMYWLEMAELSSRKLTFLLIVPVWDRETRVALQIDDNFDMQHLSTLIHSRWTRYQKAVFKFPFYDYLRRKVVKFENDEPIHFMILSTFALSV